MRIISLTGRRAPLWYNGAMATAWVALTSLAFATQTASPPSFSRGVEHVRRGELAEAERAFTEALATHPAHAPSAIYLARIYRESGRTAEAEAVLTSALSYRSDGVGLLNELGSLLFTERRLEEAEETFRRAATARPENVRAWMGVVESRLARGESEGALAGVLEALEARPNARALHFLEAKIEARQGRYQRALGSIEKALAAEDDPIVSRAELERTHGLILMALNRDAPALTALGQAVKNDAADGEAWAAIGQIRFRRGELTEARAALETALAHAPDAAGAHFHLGEIALMEVRFADAARHFERAIEIEPSAVAAHRKLAEALLKLGRYHEARASLERALALSDTDGQTHYLLGQLLRETGDPTAAVSALFEARRLRPHHAPTRYLLGTTLASLGMSDEAEAELREFRELEAFEETAEKLKLALVENPDDVAGFENLIDFYMGHGRHEEALPLLEKARALSPMEPELAYRLAKAFVETDREREAREALAEAVALDPHHPLRETVENALERP